MSDERVGAAGALSAPLGTEPHVAIVRAELEAGRYVAVCFVPTKKGVPHAFEGMVHEFTVE